MLINVFHIPDTFEPDDRRRRQILNNILVGTIFLSLITVTLTLITWWSPDETPHIIERSFLLIAVIAVIAIPLWIVTRRSDVVINLQHNKVLDYVMLGCILVTAVSLFSGLITWNSFAIINDPDLSAIVLPGIFMILISLVLITFNRSPKVPGWVAGTIFIVLLALALTQSDTPAELIAGRSAIVWVLPILIGVMVLRSASVFPITVGVCLLITMIGPVRPGNTFPNIYLMIELFAIAFLSWLGMSITNRAIRDARRETANKETILESIADGVLVLDLQGHLLSANPALLKMIPEEQLTKIIAKPLGKTVQWKRKVFSVTASPVPEVGTVAVFRDETRRHETERARDALIATASHELRTPLAAVMNYLELLLMLSKQGKVNPQEFMEHLTRALENSRRLQHLVNDILDQAQIQAGVLELKKQLFDLRVLFEKTRQLLDVLIKEKNLSYELNVELDVPAEIVGDAERLQQVLVNLIGNAIKFTNQGGIKVSASIPRKNELYIQVADSGPGIPPEQLPDIFEAFRRGSNYAQRERQGAGLGLSIAKEIVTRMGGEIFVASEPGVGSTFTFILPVEEA